MAIEAMRWAWGLPIKSGCKLVLLALADAANKDTGICWPGYNELSKKCSLDKATVLQHVSELCALGVISKKHTHDQRGYRRNNTYTVHFFKDDEGAVDESQSCKNQVGEIQTGVFPIGENPSLSCNLPPSRVVNPNGNIINHHITNKEPSPENIVFDYWKVQLKHPNAKFDSKRKSKIAVALKQYTVDDLCLAIDGCSKSPFHLGQNDRHTRYDGIAQIFRDADQIEKFIALAQGDEHASLSLTQIEGVE